MEINLTKAKARNIIETLEHLYEDKEYAITEIANGCMDTNTNAIRLIKSNERIDSMRRVLLILDVQAMYANGEVKLYDTRTDEEITF